MLGHLGELGCLCCAIVLLARYLCVCNSLGGPTSTSSLHLLLAAAWEVGHNLFQDAWPGEVLQANEAKGEERMASNKWAIVICSTMSSLGLTYSTAKVTCTLLSCCRVGSDLLYTEQHLLMAAVRQ